MKQRYRKTATTELKPGRFLLTRVLLPIFIIACVTGIRTSAYGENIVASVAIDTIKIDSSFTGANIALFGAIERNSNTAARKGDYSIVVVVDGPPQTRVVWKKKPVAGIWINRYSQTIMSAPSLRIIMANKSLAEISDPPTLDRFQIGIDNMVFIHPGNDELLPYNQEFNKAFINYKKQKGLYRLENKQRINFLSRNIFKGIISLPANMAVGTYSIRIFLFSDSIILTQSELNFKVVKHGIEETVYRSSLERPALYGLTAIMLALIIGWLGNALFKSD